MKGQSLEQKAKTIVMEKLIKFTEKYPNKFQNYDGISSNPNLTMEIINKYQSKDWNWEKISCNPNLSMEMIEKTQESLEIQAPSSRKVNNATSQLQKH